MPNYLPLKSLISFFLSPVKSLRYYSGLFSFKKILYHIFPAKYEPLSRQPRTLYQTSILGSMLGYMPRILLMTPSQSQTNSENEAHFILIHPPQHANKHPGWTVRIAIVLK